MAPLLVATAPAAAIPKTQQSPPPPPRLETVLSGSEHGFGSGAASGAVSGADHPLQRLAVSSAAHQAAAALGLHPPSGVRRLTRTASEASAAYRLALEGHGPVAIAAATAAAPAVGGVMAGGSSRRAPSGRASFAGGALSTLSASGGVTASGGVVRHLGSGAAAAGNGGGGGSVGFGEEEDEREEERSLRDATLAYLRQLSDASNSFTTRHGAGGQQHQHLHGGGGSGGCGSGGHSGGVSPSTTSIVPSSCGTACTAPDSPVKPTYHRSILGGDSDTSHHQELERGSHHVALTAAAVAAAAHHHHLPAPHQHYPSAGSIAARAAAATAIAAAGRGSLDTNRAAKAAAAMPHCGRVEVDSGVFGAAACARGQVCGGGGGQLGEGGAVEFACFEE